MNTADKNDVFDRDELAINPVDLAGLLLGAVIESRSAQGAVSARIVEVEAYCGADDPASHSYRGKTDRNAVMWGPAGHLYVYFIYGMHFCANVVGYHDGKPGGVLLRAAEIVSGEDLARSRRKAARHNHELAKGPARLASALGLKRTDNGTDLLHPSAPVVLRRGERVPSTDINSGPRVGVAAAIETPWRFWIDSPAVSPYRMGGKKRSGSGNLAIPRG